MRFPRTRSGKFLNLRTGMIALTVSFSLAACVGTVGRQSLRGDYSSIATETKGQDYTSLSVMNHYNVCNAFLSMQQISKVDECMAPLWKRAYTEDFSAGGLYTYTKDYIDILLNSIEANKFIEIGDFESALGYAEKAYAATKRDPRAKLNQALSVFTSITTLGLNNPNAKDGYNAKYSRQIASAEPYGLVATIETLRGNGARAEQMRARLRTIYDKSGKSAIDHAPALAIVRRWLAQSYYVAGDYEAAYDISTRDDRSAGMKARDAFASGLILIEKPVLDAITYSVSGTTFDDIGFANKFPAEIMLYRSAFKTGRLDVARKGFDELLAEERAKGFASLYFRLLHERAQISLAEKDETGAERFLKRAIELLEAQRSQLAQESYKLGFVGDKLVVYADMIKLLFAQGRYEEAFEYVERGKAQALVDLLASKSEFKGGTGNAETKALLDQHRQLEAESRTAAPSTKSTKVRSARETLGKIKATSAELGSLVTVSASSVKEIQGLLGPDEALIEYFYQDSEAYVFVVRKDSVKAVPFAADDLHDDVADFRDAIDDYQSNNWRPAANSLYRRLIAPIKGSLKGVRHLTIVPHGALHYLPFNALGRDPLIENHTVRLLPSASTLWFLDKKNKPTADMLVFGNPDLGDASLDLPGAEQEANGIAGLWSDSQVLFRKTASESVAKKSAGAFRFLHFASHGEFNPDEPMQSRMLLAPDGENDGSLTISEIYDLRLNADMVTLSACQTGLGDVKNGDDVIGLNRGFLYAGAKSVVASLWNVPDDSTRDLMIAFYRNLRTMDQRTALQKAQLSTRAKYSHPIFWAAFQMTGGT